MRFFSSSRRTGSLAAVQLTAQGVQYARLAPGARPAVLEWQQAPVDWQDAPAFERLAREWHLHRQPCTLLLNAGEYQMLQVEAPNVPADEVKTAMRWRIKDLLDYSVEQATIDVLPVPAHPDTRQAAGMMYAVAAHNETVRARMLQFKAARIPLAVIDIPEMAQRNMAALFEEPQRGLALLSFNAQGGLLTFSFAGELYHARRIDLPMAQLAGGLPEQRQALLERLALELQRSMDFFDRQYSFIPIGRLLLAPLPEGLEVYDYLSERLYVPVQPADLAQVLDCSRTPALQQPAYLAAAFYLVGAALRQEAA